MGRRPKVENEPLQHMCYANRIDMGSIPIIAGSPRSLSWSPTLNGHVTTHPDYVKSHYKDLEIDVMSKYGLHGEGCYNLKHETMSQCDHCSEPFQNQYTYAGGHGDMTGYGSFDHGTIPTSNLTWKMEATYSATSCVQNNYTMMTRSPSTTLPINVTQGDVSWQVSQQSPSTTSEVSSDDQWDNGMRTQSGKASVSLTIPEVQAGAVAALAYANLYRDKTVDHKPEDINQNVCMADDRPGDSNHVDIGQSKSYTELVPLKTVSCENTYETGWHGQRVELSPNKCPAEKSVFNHLASCDNERTVVKDPHQLVASRIHPPREEPRKRRLGSAMTLLTSSYLKRKKHCHWSEDEQSAGDDEDDEESCDEETGEIQHDIDNTRLSAELVERLIEAFADVTTNMQHLWQHHLRSTSLVCLLYSYYFIFYFVRLQSVGLFKAVEGLMFD